MKRTISIWLGLLAIALLPVIAQTPAAFMGKIHGHVTNPTGATQTSGTVSLSTDRGHTSMFTYQVSPSGDYAGEATPGTYTMVFRQMDTPPNKVVDSFNGIQIVAGQNVLQDIDMSRSEFIDKLPPEQKKQLEELKKHNAEAMKSNENIRILNSDLKIVAQDNKDILSAHDAATKAAKYSEIEALMLKDTQVKPDASVLWVALGQAQTGLKKNTEAESSYMRALELEKTARSPNLQLQSLANDGLRIIHASSGIVASVNMTSPAIPKMTNNEVIQLVTAGLSDQVVTNSIKQAPNKDFDLAPTGLIALKKAGVSDAVIAVMQESGPPAQAAPAYVAPQPPPAPEPPPAAQPTPDNGCSDIDFMGVFQEQVGPGVPAWIYTAMIRNKATYEKEVDIEYVKNGEAAKGTFNVKAGQKINAQLDLNNRPPTDVRMTACR